MNEETFQDDWTKIQDVDSNITKTHQNDKTLTLVLIIC